MSFHRWIYNNMRGYPDLRSVIPTGTNCLKDTAKGVILNKGSHSWLAANDGKFKE